MWDDVLISDSELIPYGAGKALVEKVRSLLKHQIENWPLANSGYESLSGIQLKAFEFDNFLIKVQFNPGRITSSTAKVDEQSIRERKCFLCRKHLPVEQKGLAYFRDYLILVNPFPIFPEHLTIPKFDHIPQRILHNLEGMLQLTKDIGSEFTVFYNGPKCGASAPDHMHYQAGKKNYMPLDYEYENIIKKTGDELFSNNDLRVWGVSNSFRHFFSIESKKIKSIISAFEKIYFIIDELKKSDDDEPMFNLISSYENGSWRVLIFPRQKHRPTQYFRTDEKQILLSPASVDLAGVCVIPREEDFEKINSRIIEDIFRQVCITKEVYEYFKKHIREEFKLTSRL